MFVLDHTTIIIIYSLLDPALDLDASNVAAYQKTLNTHHLVIVPEGDPCEFHIHPLSGVEAREARVAAFSASEGVTGASLALAHEYFQRGVSKISGLPGAAEVRVKRGQRVPLWAQEMLRAEVMEEIGQYVLTLSSPAHGLVDEGKRPLP